ncbi:MAG: SGNH/GDSL hydrolase family protein [Planctomycetota bacterium]
MTGSALERDFNFTREGVFVVDVPNGTYDVTVTAGDLGRWWHDQMGFYLEGALVDTLSTGPGQVLPPKTYEVAVEDGQLTLLLDDLGGTDPNVCIVALEVIPIQLTPGTNADDVSVTNEDDDSPPTTLGQGDGFVANMNNEALPVEAHFDFGEPSSPVESGYTRVTEATRYTPELGYGWLTGEVTSRDRAVGSALERDFNFTREGVFVVDVPDGTYDVTITAGDLGLWWHDQMGFYLEGALVDTLSTDPGQVLPPQTYEVTINDGQLTLLLKDLDGTDPNVCIVALEVVPIQLTPGITVTPMSGLTTTESGGTATFTVRLDTAPTENVSIDLSSNKPLEGTVSPSTLTFTPTDWNVEKPVTVTGVDDPAPDGNQPYTIVTARADSADPHYNVIDPADVSVTNVDDDAPPFESHFDFGQSTSPVESGYTRVTEASRYTPELGYGWLSGEITSRDRAVGSALERDFNFTREGVFVVDVPSGTYGVTVTAGDLDRWWHDQMGFYLEEVLVDTLSTGPGQVLPPQTYEVSVNDGQLTLLLRDLGGTDPNVCIEALDIEVRDTTPPVVTIESPATGLMTDTNVTVTGHVTDDLSGVALLEGQVDSNSFFAITFDGSGNFTFDTTLPLDGSADGEHTCRLRATDHAGNVSGLVEVAFTLEIAGANRAITTDPGVQQMPSIAVNPLDSNHLVIAYMDYSLVDTRYAGIGVAVSQDGGTTWQHTSIPLPENFDEGAANPITKFDDQGQVFVSFMAATFLGEKPPLTNPNFWNPEQGRSDRSLGMQANNGVFVAGSDDGGLTWNQPVAVVSHLYDGENDVPFEVIPDLAIDTFPQLPPGRGLLSEIVVFGDSLSDTGNVFAATTQNPMTDPYPPSPPYFDGRYSNGPVWVERLALEIGVPVPSPSLMGGINYAFGDAETGSGLSPQEAPNLGMQIDTFLASNALDGDELIVVWGGANDFISGQTDPSVPVANLSSHISTLAAVGGESFLVLNLPPLGQTPAVRGTPLEGPADAAAAAFNSLLSAELGRLESDLGVTVYRLDVHGLFTQAIADPASFGLTNVTDRALDPDTGPVPNPDEYLFWDDIHPTGAAHQFLGEQGAALLPALPNPNYGNMYAVWTRLYPAGQFPGEPESTGGGDIMIAVSRDGGQSWETQLEEQEVWNDLNGDGIRQEAEVTRVDRAVIQIPINNGQVAPGLAYVDQAHLAVGPAGDIYVSHFGGFYFAVHHSVDAGASFVGPDYETGNRLAFAGTIARASADGLPTNHFRMHTVRAIAADPVRPGCVYAVEPIEVANLQGHPIDAADVFFDRSCDLGETWQTEFTDAWTLTGVLNDDNEGQVATGGPEDVISGQAMARLVADAERNIGVIWYDTRRDPANHLLDVFGTVSTDGGQTFSPNFRITDVSFDADEGSFISATGGEESYLGDFIGLAMTDNVAYAAWTDTRNGNQDIFFASHSIDPAPEPLNDRFEPNDTPELDTTPTILGRVVQRLVPKLAVSPGDEDWFLVEAAATGELIASTLFADETTVPPDALGLELWDAAASTLLATGTEVLDGEGTLIGRELRFPSDFGQTFLVRVLGAESGDNDAKRVSYSLRLQSLTADLGTRAFAGVDGSLPPGGVAAYRVSAAAAGSIQLQLTGGDNVEGDLNMQIVDPETFDVLVSGKAPLGLAGAASSAEPNDSIGEANPTGLTGLGSVSLDSIIGDGDFGDTSGDYDFFSFEAAASRRITVDVDALGSGLDSMIALYDSAGNSLEMVDYGGPSDAESLSFVTQTADTYFVAVMAWGSGFPADPLTAGTGAGVGTTGVFRATIATEALGPGAVEQASLPVQQGQTVLLLVSGEDGSSGNFTLEIANLDQFTTEDNATLLFPAGAGPWQVGSADLNADGNRDLVVSNGATDTISVLLGNGDGTFQAPRQSAIGAFLAAFLVLRRPQIADLNGDSIPDIVVTNSASSDVSVLLGRGDGTFAPHRRFDAPADLEGLEIADVDLDGTLVARKYANRRRIARSRRRHFPATADLHNSGAHRLRRRRRWRLR